VPFALRWLHAQLPALLGRPKEGGEQLYSLLELCRRQEESSSAAASAAAPGAKHSLFPVPELLVPCQARNRNPHPYYQLLFCWGARWRAAAAGAVGQPAGDGGLRAGEPPRQVRKLLPFLLPEM
jgi:hypothetical protein